MKIHYSLYKELLHFYNHFEAARNVRDAIMSRYHIEMQFPMEKEGNFYEDSYLMIHYDVE